MSVMSELQQGNTLSSSSFMPKDLQGRRLSDSLISSVKFVVHILAEEQVAFDFNFLKF